MLKQSLKKLCNDMVSSLEDLSGIKATIAHANDLELKKEVFSLSKLDLDCDFDTKDFKKDYSKFNEKFIDLSCFENSRRGFREYDYFFEDEDDSSSSSEEDSEDSREFRGYVDLFQDLSRFPKNSGDIIEYTNLFQDIEKTVLDSLQKVPCRLREKISTPVIIFCILNSVQWAKFHKEKFDLPFDYGYYFLKSSFFTTKGMINKEMAARELVKDIKISSFIRFCIACHYCLSDSIPALWEELPEDKRPKIENDKYRHDLGKGGDNEMVILWSHYLLGDLQSILKKGESFSYSKFRLSFENDVAFKICFKELNELERNKAVIFSRDRLSEILDDKPRDLFSSQLYLTFHPYIEMVMFLLGHLDKKQLEVFFLPYKMLYLVLYHTLSLPYQNLFMDTLNQFGENLSKFGFYLLLNRIVKLMKNQLYSKLCDYRRIFKEFWVQSPSSLKSFFFYSEYCDGNYGRPYYRLSGEEGSTFAEFKTEFRNFNNRHLIYELLMSSPFTIEDEKIVRLIFESANPQEKSYIEQSQWRKIFYNPFYSNCDMRQVDLFVECCVSIGEARRRFQRLPYNNEATKKYLWKLILKGKLNHFHKILNWGLYNDEKHTYLKNLLLYSLTAEKIISYKPYQWNFIEKILELNLPSDEIKELKKRFLLSVIFIKEHCNCAERDKCKYVIFQKDFQEKDFYSIGFLFHEWKSKGFYKTFSLKPLK